MAPTKGPTKRPTKSPTKERIGGNADPARRPLARPGWPRIWPRTSAGPGPGHNRTSAGLRPDFAPDRAPRPEDAITGVGDPRPFADHAFASSAAEQRSLPDLSRPLGRASQKERDWPRRGHFHAFRARLVTIDSPPAGTGRARGECSLAARKARGSATPGPLG